MFARFVALLAIGALLSVPPTLLADERVVRVKNLTFEPVPLYEDPELTVEAGQMTQARFETYDDVRVAQTGPSLTLLIRFDETLSAWVSPFYLEVDADISGFEPCNILIVGHDPAGVRSIGESCKKETK